MLLVLMSVMEAAPERRSMLPVVPLMVACLAWAAIAPPVIFFPVAGYGPRCFFSISLRVVEPPTKRRPLALALLLLVR